MQNNDQTGKSNKDSQENHSKKLDTYTKWEYRGYQIVESELYIFLYLEGEISNIKVILNDNIDPSETNNESENFYEFKFVDLKNGINSIRISDKNNNIFSAAINNKPFNGQTADSGISFTIQVNEEVKIKDSGMIIRLISLSKDSRCEDPTDKYACMHDPFTHITFQLSAPKYHPESITVKKPQTENVGAVFHDFPFLIEEIAPPPKNGEVIEQSKYQVTMKVH